MSVQTGYDHQQSVNRFWHNYLSILEKSSIPERARPWYRTHVEETISALQGVKLMHHLPQYADDYIIIKGSITNLPEWRSRQIADALLLPF